MSIVSFFSKKEIFANIRDKNFDYEIIIQQRIFINFF
jgi:hypothetical protein